MYWSSPRRPGAAASACAGRGRLSVSSRRIFGAGRAHLDHFRITAKSRLSKKPILLSGRGNFGQTNRRSAGLRFGQPHQSRLRHGRWWRATTSRLMSHFVKPMTAWFSLPKSRSFLLTTQPAARDSSSDRTRLQRESSSVLLWPLRGQHRSRLAATMLPATLVL